MPRSRISLLSLLAGGLLLLGVGCGGDSTDNSRVQTPDAGAGADSNVTSPDGGSPPTGGECVGNSECELTERCNDNNECVQIDCTNDSQTCRGELRCNTNNGNCVECTENSHCIGPDTVCQNNSCQRTDVECRDGQGNARIGEKCNPENQTGTGLTCVDLGQQEDQNDTGHRCVRIFQTNKSCGGGEVCLPVDHTQYDKLNQNKRGLCLVNQCDSPFDHQDCNDVGSNAFFPNLESAQSKKCARIERAGTEANICVPSGSKGVGEYCDSTFCPPGVQNCNACQQGLTCVENSCQPLCRSDSECGNQGQTCIGENNSDIALPTTGFCGEQCDAYSRGTCSDGDKGCAPLNDDTGFCRQTGSGGYFTQCSRDTDCKEGMDCRLGVCTPICQAPPAGSNDTASNARTCRGFFHAQFVHVGSAPNTIDVYVNGELVADDLGVGEASDRKPNTPEAEYLKLRPGLETTTVEVTPGSANRLEGSVVARYEEPLQSGPIRTWAIDPNASTSFREIATTRRIESPGDGNVKIRVAHYVRGLDQNVEIVGLPRDEQGNLPRGNSGDLDWSQAVALSGSLAFGGVDSYRSVADSNYDVFAFPAGTNRSTSSALARFKRQSFGSIQTLYLHGSADRGDVAASAIGFKAPANLPDYSCWNRQQETEPDPASGYCIDSCELSDYGKDNCTVDQFSCTEANGRHLCIGQSGSREPGQSCSSGTFGQPCREGAECRAGTCYANCVGGGHPNDALGCRSSTSCQAAEGEFGVCGQTCNPSLGDDNADNNFSDTSCPDGLQNCIPSRVDSEGNAVGAFCSSNGDKAKGATCGGGHTFRATLDQNCQPGLRCTQSSGFKSGFSGIFTGMWQHQYQDPDNLCLPYEPAEEDPRCRETCRLFDGDQECGPGKGCFPDIAITGSSVAGVCLRKAGQETKQDQNPCSNKSAGDSCGDNAVCITEGSSLTCYQMPEDQEAETGSGCDREDVGKLCGENSICVQESGSSICYELCDWNTKEGCSGTATCSQQFTDNIGLCEP